MPNLPFLKKQSSTNPRKYLFALEIGAGVVKSAVWSVVNNKPQVLSVGLSASWDDKTLESLISACDRTLSDAADHLDPSGKVDIAEMILGLPKAWVDEEKIRSHYLSMLRDMGQKLDLKPVGFVITSEAVLKFLHKTENVPPTAVLLGIWPTNLQVTLVRLGKSDGTEVVRRSPQIAEDVVEGLARFQNVDVLPSRMLLYDSGMDLEDVKQQLLRYPWQTSQTKLAFLHFPKVEILPADFTVRAVALAGGSEVAKVIGLLPESEATREATTEFEEADNDLGFISDADIRSVSKPSPPIVETAIQSYTAEPMVQPAQNKSKFRFSLPKIRLPNFNLFRIKLPLKGVWIGLPVLVILLGLVYWYVPRAEVIVFVNPQNFEAAFELTADTRQDRPDLESRSIPAQVLVVELTDNKTTSTTGSMQVGEKATGKVTISNALDNSRAIPAGTVITSPSGLKFLVKETVTVASASGSAGSLTPGKIDAEVEAENIGGDYNLSSGTIFRVGNFAITQIDARNESAFSGGSSRQVQAVAKGDLDKLRRDLVDRLKEEARSKLMSQITDQQKVIDETISTETVSENFNRKLGEEADEVTLTLAVKAIGMVVSQADLQSLIDSQIHPQIPQGYTSLYEQSQAYSVKKTEVDRVVLEASVTALLLPQLDQNQAVLQIRGKSPNLASDYLRSLPGVVDVDILLTPRLPAGLTTLPRVAKNISLSVKPAR